MKTPTPGLPPLAPRKLIPVVLSCLIPACAFAGAERSLSRAELLDRIRGGWAGQMIGVAFGAPTEFKSLGQTYELDLAWKPGMLENTIHQDDLYVEMTFARVMDTLGLEATTQDYGRAFRDSKYQLWHANAGARRALNRGIEAPWSGHPRYNIHANDIDFQIEADFIGLMCPGLPQESNRYCDRVGRVMNHGDGLYGGMFVCGMYAAAYFEQDPRRVVEAGLACIPAESAYGRTIRDVLDWSSQHPDDWRRVWRLVGEKWDRDDACPDGFLRPFNIDAKINGAYIAFGLLYGGADFGRTLEVATRCGQDSDCNPSSAAGVLGVMLGYERIPEAYRVEIPGLAERKFDFTDYSFSEIVASTEARALRVIRSAGGRVTDAAVFVPPQRPAAPPLEQWSPGLPDRRVAWDAPEWSFTGPWRPGRHETVATGGGCEAVFSFRGVAVAVLGRPGSNGGRAEVFLDGRKQEMRLDAYVPPETHDNVLWHTYGLEPGEHILKIVVTDDADARSGGREVPIREAVVYRACDTAGAGREKP